MAKKRQTPSERIEALVKLQHEGGMFDAGLAVNPGFAEPNRVDKARGVEPDAPEREQAERAVAARALAQLIPEKLRLWIFHQEQRRGGSGELVKALMAVKPVPAGRDATLYRKALRRAIERSGPATKPGRKEQHTTITKADYRERIALLILGESQVVLGVYGLWAYVTEGERDEHYATEYTDPSDGEELETARRIVAAGGAGLVAYVEEVNDRKTVGSAVLQLVKLHGVHVQVDMGRAA